MHPGQLPPPEFLITGFWHPAAVKDAAGDPQPGIQFYACRDLTGHLEVNEQDYASVISITAHMKNTLIARAGSWAEAFELVARRWALEQEAQAALASTGAKGIAPPPDLEEVWVRILVPKDGSHAHAGKDTANG